MTAPTRMPLDLSTCYAQVLVPVDFSSLSWTSLSAAIALAHGFGIPYRVVHIDTSWPWPDLQPRNRTLHVAPNGQRVPVEVIAARTAADGIVQLLGDDESSLLVMSSHGHTAAAELALGSTAEDVLRRWQGAVVLTGPHYRTTRPAVTRIVAAIPPFGELSAALATDLRGWAEWFAVPMQVVTVMDAASMGYDFEQGREQLLYLIESAQAIGADPVPLHGSRTAHELVTYANAQPGTLLAMAPRVKTATAQLVLGSVSKAVLRHATNPVLFRPA